MIEPVSAQNNDLDPVTYRYSEVDVDDGGLLPAPPLVVVGWPLGSVGVGVDGCDEDILSCMCELDGAKCFNYGLFTNDRGRTLGTKALASNI